MFRSVEKNPDRTTYDGRDDDEKILYVIRQSPITLVPSAFLVAVLVILPIVAGPYMISFKVGGQLIFSTAFTAIAALFWYVAVFGYFFQLFLSWYFNAFIITSKKIVDMDFMGLLYKNVSEASLYNIEDVTSTVGGAFGVVFNIGSVFVQTAAEREEFEFENIDNPSEIRDAISDLVSNLKHRDGNN